MKKIVYKALPLILVLSFILCGLSGCTMRRAEPLPETTGAELGVYVLDGKIVDENAEEILENGVPVYRFDEDGNIVTKGEKKDVIVIAASNVSDFTCLNEAVVEDKDTKQKIPVYVLSDDSEIYGIVTWELPISVGPANAVNSKITVETTDKNTLFFNDGESKLEFDGKEPIVLKITGCYSGEAKILITNCLGEVIKTIDISLTGVKSTDAAAIAEIEEKVANCNHEYVSEVVSATETAEGYTIHTCKLCGHVYRDNYTDKLPCSHTFTEREIKATCTEQGYTLCTCSKCGFSEKKNLTPLAEHIYRDEVVPATCTQQGYTSHTCTVCGHSERDTLTPLAAHNYRDQVVPSTCSTQGYTLHTCSVCNSSYKDNYTPLKEHTFQNTTVAPTYTERGYTLHTCTVCGYSNKDSYVDKLVCTNHNFAETGRTAATCAATGSVTKTCTICGKVTTESIPALGHQYKDSVVQPTCTAQGCTTHTCTVCGSTYTDTNIPALGHEWVGHEEQRQVGMEEHDFCNACGMDLHGMDAWAHCEQHALAGEQAGYHSGLVPIYGTITVRVCTRCGAEQ